MARKRPPKKSSAGQVPSAIDDQTDEQQSESEEIERSAVALNTRVSSSAQEIPSEQADEIAESTTLDKRLDEAFTQLENEADETELQKNSKPNNTQSAKGGSVEKVKDKRSSSEEAPKSGGGILVTFAMLFSLIALVVAGYAAYLVYESSQALGQSRAAVQALENKLANQQEISDQKIGQLAGELKQTRDQLTDSLENESTAIAELHSSVANATEQLRAELKADLDEGLGTSGEDWLLAEVEYLIRLANQRVLMERDVGGALSLLSSADEIVEQTSGTAAFDLREALALDIANLEAVTDLDTDGVFLSLSAMSSQVPQLQRKRPEMSRTADVPVVTTEGLNFYQQFLAVANNIATRVLNSVDYRRDGVAITPILPPKEEYYLRQNLVLKFEMAQLALLRNDGAVYKASLAEARAWVAEHFIGSDPKTVAILSSLNKASDVVVDRELPNISGSLRAARDLMNRFHQQDSRGAVK